MRNSIYLIVFFLVLGCTSDKNTTVQSLYDETDCGLIATEYTSPEILNDLTIILADFYSSLSEQTVTKVKSDIESILNLHENNSRIILYSIDDGMSFPKIFDYQVNLSGTRSFQRERKKQIHRCLSDSIIKIVSVFNLDEVDPSTPISCITKAFRFADTEFRTLGKRDTVKYNFNLFILSDMLEECSTSIVDGHELYMHKSNLSKVNESIDRTDSGLNLEYVNLYVCLSTSQDNYTSKFLKDDDLYNVWKSILTEMNVSKKSIDSNIPFSTSLPLEL